MRSAILSINLHTDRLNYGAVLHSYIFQKLMLRREDMESCTIIDYLPTSREGFDPCKYWFHRTPITHPVKRIADIWTGFEFIKRDREFKRFFKERLDITDRRYNYEELNDAHLDYDAVFFESDVIWSPTYMHGQFDPAFFGKPDSMKHMRKIAYSASMGDGILDEAHTEALRELLKYPDAISMRERYAAETVRKLTDKPVADVLDPVLLAKPEDFDEITSARLVEKPYLLVYFPLSNRRKEVIRAANRYAKEHGLQVVEVSNGSYNKLFRKHFGAAGIEDFLSLVRNADAVFCNSLHGVCLSLIFHKEFYAFNRGASHKYRDLCERFDLADRYIGCTEFKEALPIDWTRVQRQLDEGREACMKWLDAAIKGEIK